MSDHNRRSLRAFPALLLVGLAAASVAGQTRQEVEFDLVRLIDPTERSVFVLGDLPALGGGDLTRAVKLEASAFPLWKATVSLPAGTRYTYRFYERLHGPDDIGDPSNGTPIGPETSAATDGSSVWPRAKRLLYRSSFDPPHLHWRQDDGSFETLVMEAIDAGGEPGELQWLACGFGVARRSVEFFLTSADGAMRDPADPAQVYATSLDGFLLQDGELFTYVPAADISPPRRDYELGADGLSTSALRSSILGEVRPYRVMLPRGYDEHRDRHYPVIYLHDGMFVWDDNPFVAPFDPDGATVEALTREGTMGEVIQIAIDVPATSFCPIVQLRSRDYQPPGDVCNTGCGSIAGEGDQYAAFIIDELKPLIDASYRTLPDAQHTWTTGYSLGGLAALYLGWDFNDTFTRVGPMSGAFRANFLARVIEEPWRDIRIYLDTGTVGDFYTEAIAAYDGLIGKAPPWVVERDLRYVVAFGQNHTISQGGTRLPQMMSFLYPAREAPNAFLGCPADTNCDGAVDVVDLAAVILAWGSDDADADVNADGVVDVDDLAGVILAWSSC